jgi:O-antigen/teichoic acid export membrane protein
VAESRALVVSMTSFKAPALAQAERSLLRGAYSLIANTAVTSALGMVFWITAARLYPRTTVGRDTVLISTMIELSTLCQLNMGNGIVRFLPDLGRDSARALRLAYAITGALAVSLGLAFVLVVPSVLGGLSFLADDPALGGGFVLALTLWGVFSLQDAALIATRRAPWIPFENGLFGVLKLAALPVLLAFGALHGVFLAWVLPMALLLIPINALLFRRAIPAHLSTGPRQSSIQLMGHSRALRFLGQDYLATIFTQTTLTVLPLLVIAILGAQASAYFAIPFAIALAFDTFAYSACTSLVVEATLEREHLGALARVVLRRVFTLIVPLGLLLVLAAPLVMLAFGRAYERNGTDVLRLLVCAGVLRSAIALFSAVSRIQGRAFRLGVVEFSLLVLVLGPAILLAHADGIQGVALAWLGANAIVCLALIPSLISLLRRPDGAAVHAHLASGAGVSR